MRLLLLLYITLAPRSTDYVGFFTFVELFTRSRGCPPQILRGGFIEGFHPMGSDHGADSPGKAKGIPP